jgi:AbiV family abortive infection protein
MPRKPPQLTARELLSLFRYALRNAQDLVGDAEALLLAERWPRAYALAHVAHEELAKCLGLMNMWVLSVRGDPNPWGQFWRNWRVHAFKIQLALGGSWS